jgi:very-short-patch-repair endonuclease
MTRTGEETNRADLAGRLAQVPSDRVVQLRGGRTDDIATLLAYGGTDLPAVVVHRVRCFEGSLTIVQDLLDHLEEVAVQLFPAWLPEAEYIREPGGAGVVAVRALAVVKAAQSVHFGPFLGDLAASALSGKPMRLGGFLPETRAVGLTRVLADGFGRPALVILVEISPGLHADAQHALATASAWLADRGRIGVWLTGDPLSSVDWLNRAEILVGAVIAFPRSQGLGGAPHPRSAAEAALEAVLATQRWSHGRFWNQTYQSHVLRNPVRLDLFWPAERFVVEIDGPEHCRPEQFESDRQRDVQLQLDGYAVLRFTNARVRHDVNAVVWQIGKFIEDRRRESVKGTVTWPTTT